MNPRLALTTAFGLGLLKPAPGTWGSVPPPVVAAAMLFFGAADRTINAAMLLIAAVFSISCVALGGWAERRFNTKDPRQVVADEMAGQSLALLFLPWRAGADGWTVNIILLVTAFLAFRILDVLKPPPINAVQRLAGGWGILVDDLLAGVGALGVTHAVAWAI